MEELPGISIASIFGLAARNLLTRTRAMDRAAAAMHHLASEQKIAQINAREQHLLTIKTTSWSAVCTFQGGLFFRRDNP
ncbi:MAG: hypothetical protein PHO79_00585 [Desulfoplanes sp.]|nr:hypothetical protein [Desulfoplanes sp.]MDD4648512.1 hypothetical protein [Desulfoplanes sp.]